MRTKMVAGNWKMNKTLQEGVALATELKEAVKNPSCAVLIGTPFMASSLVLNNQLRFQGSAFFGMIGMGVDYLTLMAFFYVLPGLTNGIQGYFRGMGEMKTTLIATFIQISVRALVVWLLVPRIGLNGAAWACAAGWCLMLIYTFLRYQKVRMKE